MTSTLNATLSGRWFHSWRPAEGDDDRRYVHMRGGRTVVWQGHIVEQIDAKHYVVQLYSWWDGTPTEKQLMSVDDMVGWTFYSNNIEMIASLGCSDCHSSRTAEYVAETGLGAGPVLCYRCAAHWSSVRPIIWKNDIPDLGEPMKVGRNP
ncbi:hypothetical protein VT930_11960 [Mycobacterium sherrisii]|uniref:hypothetical protein n=1 Tax=Mycobacterium sherrisii TaxID=243061 RepID=UPI002DDD8978|nr:hypothetical protein [Mycobacterium sherrisii]MEC4763819.1 hypothetical protein [Mycobacterium sherrisii]